MNFATTKERILYFIDNQSIKVSDFLRKTEIKRGFLDADKLNSAVSDIFLAKIIAIFPELSLEWLITGKGEMLKKESAIAQNGTNNIVQNGNKSKAKIISTEENVCFLREKIALLEEKEALYKDKITYLTQEIERLKSSN